MSLPRYAEYRDSGVEWLGKIPKHWGTLQSRRMFAVRSEPALASDRMLTASQKHGVLFQADFMELEGRRVVEVIMGTESLKHVEPDDFIISMRSFQGGIEWCKLRGSTSFHYVMLRPVKYVWPAYFAHLFKSSIYIQALRRTTDLIRDGQELRFSNFAQVDLPVVPIEEQKAIALFLDDETRKIDALVAEQERLIALLAEKRQATISHAVTGSINDDVPMKKSGVSWLGDVPAHWAVSRLGLLAKKIGSGKTPSGGADVYSARGVIFLRSQNVYDEGLQLDDVVFISDEIDGEMAATRVQPGDILLNITGASLGRTCLVPDDFSAANVNQHVCIIRLRDQSSREFVSLALKSGLTKAQFDAVQNGAAREGLNFEQISKIHVPLPPAHEQEEIVAFARAEVAKLDALCGETMHAIALLKERRGALVAAAVTGQIDVRGAMPQAAKQEELAA